MYNGNLGFNTIKSFYYFKFKFFVLYNTSPIFFMHLFVFVLAFPSYTINVTVHCLSPILLFTV